MSAIEKRFIDEFVAAARRAGAFDLVRATSGNLSWRIDDDRVLLTATRSWMADLAPADVSVCSLASGDLLDGPRPSVEHRFHLGIMQARPAVRAVLHFQSPAATVLACTDASRIDFNATPEVPVLIGRIGFVPFLPPGSGELAAHVVETMKTHELALMQNHGQVAVGRDLADVLEKSIFFEFTCNVILRAGERLQPLSAAEVAGLAKA